MMFRGRETILLKTVYKSPTTIHVFSFSPDNEGLFPTLSLLSSSPSSSSGDPILARTRTQVDLQGWSIEALSPTTTLVTLLEQTSPSSSTTTTSSSTNSASTPSSTPLNSTTTTTTTLSPSVIKAGMIAAVAGVGEYVIKHGAPPVLTGVRGVRVREVKYEHEKGSFKVEGEPCLGEVGKEGVREGGGKEGGKGNGERSKPCMELEIRCDLDMWASSTGVDVVVDPPPTTVSCLRRHRLSGGGGLWMTFGFDALFGEDERVRVIVRRAPGVVNPSSSTTVTTISTPPPPPTTLGSLKNLVMVNGTRVSVDVEEMTEEEMKNAKRKERVRPERVPLDQPLPPLPPGVVVVNGLRRRKTEDGVTKTSVNGNGNTKPKESSPLARFWTFAGGGVQGPVSEPRLDPSKMPLQYALEALKWTQDLYSRGETKSSQGWTVCYQSGEEVVHKRIYPTLTSSVPVHQSTRLIQGMRVVDVLPFVMDPRSEWDERFVERKVVERFGGGSMVGFEVRKGGLGLFPFRERGFWVTSVLGSFPSSSPLQVGEEKGKHGKGGGPVFVVTCSFSTHVQPRTLSRMVDVDKVNPAHVTMGRLYLDAWILEMVDPYEVANDGNWEIPSVRVTRMVAVDFNASSSSTSESNSPSDWLSLPTLSLPGPSVGGNIELARGVSGLEAFLKKMRMSGDVKKCLTSPFVVGRGGLGYLVGTTLGESGSDLSLPFMAWRLTSTTGAEERMVVDTRWDVVRGVFGMVQYLRFWEEENPSLEEERYPTMTTLGYGHPTRKRSASSGPSGMIPPNTHVRSRTVTGLGLGIATSGVIQRAIGGKEKEKEMVIVEMVVDSKSVGRGYRVVFGATPSSSSGIGKGKGGWGQWDVDKRLMPVDDTSQPFSKEKEWIDLPLVSTLYTLPNSVYGDVDVGDHEAVGERQLLRISVLVPGGKGGEVRDPLRTFDSEEEEEEKEDGDKEQPSSGEEPRWLRVMRQGMFVEVFVQGSNERSEEEVTLNGKPVRVVGEKESLVFLKTSGIGLGVVGGMGTLTRYVSLLLSLVCFFVEWR